jgi:hypothetical protein
MDLQISIEGIRAWQKETMTVDLLQTRCDFLNASTAPAIILFS